MAIQLPTLPTIPYGQPPTGYPSAGATLPYPGQVPSTTTPGLGQDTFSGLGDRLLGAIPGARAGYVVLRDEVSLLSFKRVSYNRNAGMRMNALGQMVPRQGRVRGGGLKVNPRVAYRSSPLSAIGSAVKSSVIWGSLISVGLNGYKMFKKEETTAVGVSNITGDVMSAAVGGAAAAVASMTGTTLMAGMLGTGLMLSVAGMGLGIAGFMIADSMLRKTEFFKTVTSKVGGIFG